MLRLLVIATATTLSLTLALADEARFPIVLPMDAPYADFLNTPAAVGLTLPGSTPVAGQGLSPAVSAVTYLQYEALSDDGTHRTITAALGTTLPAGVKLEVRAAAPAGCGTSTSWQQLPPAPATVEIVTAVPTCSTGDGATAGAQLQYRLSVSNMASLVACADVVISIGFAFTEPK